MALVQIALYNYLSDATEICAQMNINNHGLDFNKMLAKVKFCFNPATVAAIKCALKCASSFSL